MALASDCWGVGLSETLNSSEVDAKAPGGINGSALDRN